MLYWVKLDMKTTDNDMSLTSAELQANHTMEGEAAVTIARQAPQMMALPAVSASASSPFPPTSSDPDPERKGGRKQKTEKRAPLDMAEALVRFAHWGWR